MEASMVLPFHLATSCRRFWIMVSVSSIWLVSLLLPNIHFPIYFQSVNYRISRVDRWIIIYPGNSLSSASQCLTVKMHAFTILLIKSVCNSYARTFHAVHGVLSANLAIKAIPCALVVLALIHCVSAFYMCHVTFPFYFFCSNLFRIFCASCSAQPWALYTLFGSLYSSSSLIHRNDFPQM